MLAIRRIKIRKLWNLETKRRVRNTVLTEDNKLEKTVRVRLFKVIYSTTRMTKFCQKQYIILFFICSSNLKGDVSFESSGWHQAPGHTPEHAFQFISIHICILFYFKLKITHWHLPYALWVSTGQPTHPNAIHCILLCLSSLHFNPFLLSNFQSSLHSFQTQYSKRRIQKYILICKILYQFTEYRIHPMTLKLLGIKLK